jgi:hypothetical protein
MNFPALGSIALVGPTGAACAGAAFELAKAARESESVAVDGWHVDVCGGKKLVVARGGVEDKYDDAFRSGLLALRTASTSCPCGAATTS